MISANLNVTQNPMVQGYTKPHRVNPIPPLQQLRDCTQQRESWNGEKESEKQKQTESLQKQVPEVQESINTAKTFSLESMLSQICLMQRCSTQSNPCSTKSTTSTVWKHHYGLTIYKSLAQLTVSQSSKVNCLS